MEHDRPRRYPVLAAGMAVLATAAASAPANPDPFAPVAPLLGRWEGTVEGRPGTGTVPRAAGLHAGTSLPPVDICTTARPSPSPRPWLSLELADSQPHVHATPRGGAQSFQYSRYRPVGGVP